MPGLRKYFGSGEQSVGVHAGKPGGRLAVVTEIISPYRIPVFNQIAEELGDRFAVFFMAENEAKRHWIVSHSRIRFRYEVLHGRQFRRTGAIDVTYSWNPAVITRLRAFQPDVVVIGGYHHPTSYAALFFTKATRTKLVLWCESHEADWRSGTRWREAIKRIFIRCCDGYLVPGTASRRYLNNFGVDNAQILLAPNCTDTDVFSVIDEYEEQATEGDMIKSINPAARMTTFNLLFVGRLAPEKGFPVVVEVVSTLQAKGVDIGLWVVGDGPKRQEYENMARVRGLKQVTFAGFQDSTHLKNYYKQADILIMPSISEPWGMVVNEAMTYGLPVMCSPSVGAAADMVIDGETGHICGSTSCYVDLIEELIKYPKKLDAMGQECRNMASRYSPKACASGFIKALEMLR